MTKLEDVSRYWCKVNYNGNIGYVKSALLIPTEGGQVTMNAVEDEYTEDIVSDEGTGQMYSLIQKTSFRSRPDSQSTVMKRFRPGDQVELIEKVNKYWWKIYFDGKSGYVKASCLDK